MAEGRTRRDTLLAVSGLLLALFLVALDQTVVGTAMPRVIADLRGFELYAWVTTIYLLAQTAVIPIAGKLGDMYGRKWLAIAGVAIFLAGSWLCGFSQDMVWLIAARGIQGIGAGTILSTVFTLIADVFPNPAERARYQGFFFAVFALSSVIGPLIGGAITEAFGWRWVFYVNLPLGILSLIVLPFVLPHGTRLPGKQRIDWLGAFTITVSVVSLLLALTWIGDGAAWTAPQVLAGFVVAAISLALFVLIELRTRQPIIPFDIFRDRAILMATLIIFFSSAGMFGVILYTPLYLQGVLGTSPAASGIVMLPLVLTMTAMSFVVGQLVSRTGRVRPFMIVGAGLMTAGSVLLTTLGTTTSEWTVAAFLFVEALGIGMLMPNTTITVQAAADPRNMGAATAATQFVRSIGSTVGVALIGTLVAAGYYGTLQAHVPPGVPTELLHAIEHPDALVSPEAMQTLTQLTAALPDGPALMTVVLDAARSALTVGIQHGFILGAVLTGLCVLGAILMPDLRLDRKHAPPILAEKAELAATEGPAVVVAPM
jgi:EmrB/QacA subfamily drug resistance transporter